MKRVHFCEFAIDSEGNSIESDKIWSHQKSSELKNYNAKWRANAVKMCTIRQLQRIRNIALAKYTNPQPDGFGDMPDIQYYKSLHEIVIELLIKGK